MAHGPCGPEFREAFSCFIYSEEEPKGINCVEKFKGMQDCFRAHPDIYGEGNVSRFIQSLVSLGDLFAEMSDVRFFIIEIDDSPASHEEATLDQLVKEAEAALAAPELADSLPTAETTAVPVSSPSSSA